MQAILPPEMSTVVMGEDSGILQSRQLTINTLTKATVMHTEQR